MVPWVKVQRLPLFADRFVLNKPVKLTSNAGHTSHKNMQNSGVNIRLNKSANISGAM